VVQVKTCFESALLQRLRLTSETLVSSFDINLHLRPYTMAASEKEAKAAADAAAAEKGAATKAAKAQAETAKAEAAAAEKASKAQAEGAKAESAAAAKAAKAGG